MGRLRLADDSIGAEVQGTHPYRVELRDEDGDLAYDCTCPRAADGYFCKHCVAVGLVWLEESGPEEAARAERAKRRNPWQGIQDYLAAQPAETLIELLLDVVRRDDRLYQSLRLKAEWTGGAGDRVAAFRRAIDEATRIHGFVDWREVGAFAGNLAQVVDALAELLAPD